MIVNALQGLVNLGEVEEASIANDDTLDAAVSALVAWMAASACTFAPDTEEAQRLAKIEGCIHLPSSLP